MKKRFLYLPMLLIELYLIGTLVLFKWGPYKWHVKEPMFFWPVIFLYMLTLWMGYFFGIILKRKKSITFKTTMSPRSKNHIFLFVAILAMMGTYFETVRNLGLNTLNPLAILEQTKVALSDSVTWYRYTYSSEFIGTFGGKYLSVAILVITPFVFAVVPLSIYWFKELKTYNRILGLSAISFQILKAISSGKNKGLFDIVFYIGIVFFIRILKENLIKKKNSGKNFLICFAIFFLIINIVLKFGSVIDERLGGDWLNYQVGGYSVNLDSALLKITPSAFKGLLVYLTMYLTQGYQALAMITDMSWIPLWGIGHSKFLVEYMSKYFGTDIASKTYQYRLDEFGWGHDLNWHSLYLYIANDTSVIGVAFVMFLLGLLFAIVYYEALYSNSVLSLLLLIQLCIICLYIPANNIIFNHIGSFVTFYIIFILWLFNKTTFFQKIKKIKYFKRL